MKKPIQELREKAYGELTFYLTNSSILLALCTYKIIMGMIYFLAIQIIELLHCVVCFILKIIHIIYDLGDF